MLRDFVRRTRFSLEFDTVHNKVKADRGVRIQVAPWDRETEALLLSDSPNLMSLGSRCMLKGFTHVWVNRLFPCFLSHGCRYIVILDLEGVLPVWSQDLEEGTEMFGTFEFWNNTFKEQCGIFINPQGQICLDLPKPASFRAASPSQKIAVARASSPSSSEVSRTDNPRAESSTVLENKVDEKAAQDENLSLIHI